MKTPAHDAAIALLLIMMTSRVGAQGAPAFSAPARATSHTSEPGKIDTARSRVYARVHKTGLGHEHGIEGRVSQGYLRLNGSPSGQLTFDMATFEADTSAGRRYVGLEGEKDSQTQKDVTQTMHSADVLDVSRYPTAEFVLQRAVPHTDQAGRWDLYGDFTLHGVHQPVKIVAQAATEQGVVHIQGGFAILQSNFGMQPLRKAFGAIGVADQMEIWGDLYLAAP